MLLVIPKADPFFEMVRVFQQAAYSPEADVQEGKEPNRWYHNRHNRKLSRGAILIVAEIALNADDSTSMLIKAGISAPLWTPAQRATHTGNFLAR